MFKLKFTYQIIPALLIALVAVFLGIYSYQTLTARSVNAPLDKTLEPTIIYQAPLSPTNKTQGELVVEARSNLAAQSDTKDSEISIVSVEPVNWPDSSLGCPTPGMVYAQVVTPGYKIVLKIKDQTYTYHTSATNIELCELTK